MAKTNDLCFPDPGKGVIVLFLGKICDFYIVTRSIDHTKEREYAF